MDLERNRRAEPGDCLRRQQVGVTQLVDHLIWDTDYVKVHDAAPRVAFNDVDHASEERVLAVTSDDQRIDHNAGGIVRFVEERPHETGRVHLMHIGGKRDSYGHRGVLTKYGFACSGPKMASRAPTVASSYSGKTMLTWGVVNVGSTANPLATRSSTRAEA